MAQKVRTKRSIGIGSGNAESLHKGQPRAACSWFVAACPRRLGSTKRLDLLDSGPAPRRGLPEPVEQFSRCSVQRRRDRGIRNRGLLDASWSVCRAQRKNRSGFRSRGNLFEQRIVVDHLWPTCRTHASRPLGSLARVQVVCISLLWGNSSGLSRPVTAQQSSLTLSSSNMKALSLLRVHRKSTPGVKSQPM